MSACSPNGDLSQRSAPPPVGVDNSTAALLDHFDQLALMLELIDRLPDIAEDIRLWRPRVRVECLRYGALGPVARNAFDAVAAGLNTLALSAVALCEDAGGRLPPDEIAACREIGVVMDRLLGRARALIETAEESAVATARRRPDGPILPKKAG